MKIQAFLIFVLFQFQALAQNERTNNARADVRIGNLEDYDQALEIKNQIRSITFKGYQRFNEAIETKRIDFTQFPNLSTFNFSISTLDSVLEVKLFQDLVKCNLYQLSIFSNHKHDYSIFSQIAELGLSGRTVNNNESLIELNNLKEIELYYEFNGQVDSSDKLFGLAQIELFAIQGYSESTFSFEQIGKLIGLKHLHVEVDDTISEIPKEWQSLENLQQIELRGSFNIDSLPPFFYRNQNLTQIFLENNQLPNISVELFEKKGLSFALELTSSSKEIYRASQLQKFLNRKLKYPFKLKNKQRFERKLNHILNEPVKKSKTNMPSEFLIDFEYATEEYP